MPTGPDHPSKPGVACGREITWRKKWERDWDAVRYCSRACRKAGAGPADRRFEEAILVLLRSRARTASICPWEAARVLNPENPESVMEATRRAARRLAATGVVEITQGGKAVDPSRARGPIRIRRTR